MASRTLEKDDPEAKRFEDLRKANAAPPKPAKAAGKKPAKSETKSEDAES